MCDGQPCAALLTRGDHVNVMRTRAREFGQFYLLHMGITSADSRENARADVREQTLKISVQ